MAGAFIVGIDLGGTNLKIALLDLSYNIIDKSVLNTRKFAEKSRLIKAIVNSINEIIKDNALRRADIIGIGLGAPGPIDARAGIVHFFPNIPGWRRVKLRAVLKKKLKLPVFLDNDAKLMALAEHKVGAAKGLRNVVCLTLGTGVGGGTIVEGSLYRGANNASGEIGHIPVNEKGPRCNCGGIACLEAYIGNNRIIREAKRIFKRNVSLEELSYLAKKQDRRALGLWSKVAGHLGIALAGIVNLLNPDGIVIGGGVANAGSVLFDKVREVILARAMSVQARHVKILKAKLGNDAGFIGAAILVRQGAKR